MKKGWFIKCFLMSGLLIILGLCLLALGSNRIYADPPAPTPTPASDILTVLQSALTRGLEPAQSDGRELEKAALPLETQERSVVVQDQQTFTSIADATVLEGYPTQNFGRTQDMWVGYDDYLDPDGKIARSLVKFDLSSISPERQIVSATLSLYLVGSYDYPGRCRTITTYRITSGWSEDGLTWDNKPGYADADGSEDVCHGEEGWYLFDVTHLVRAWHDGTYTNHGIMLRGPEVSGSDSSWKSFGTRESSFQPKLAVEDELPSDAPRVDTIAPNNGENTGGVSVTISGANFQAGATVRLTKTGQSAINATGVAVVSPSQITGNLDLTGKATGAWDVVVTNPDAQSGTLPNGFTVTAEPSEEVKIHLPLVLRDFPFTPNAPVLNAISNADGDGSYTVSWSSSEGADTYILQEATNANFSGATTVYSGPNTSRAISGRDVGTYYYRASAANAYASSGWSNVQSVVVTVALPTCEQHDFGTTNTTWYIYSSGKSWDFVAENQMSVTRVETKSVLATGRGVTFSIQVKINGTTVASWSQYVNDTHFKAYYHSADVSFALEPGDRITYFISANTGSPVAGLLGVNYVRLCR